MQSERSGKRSRMAKTRQTCCMYEVNSSKGIMISLNRSSVTSPGHVNIARTPSMWSLRCSSSFVLGISTKYLSWFWYEKRNKPCFRTARSSFQGFTTSLRDKLKVSSCSSSRKSQSSGLAAQAIKHCTYTHSYYCVYRAYLLYVAHNQNNTQ